METPTETVPSELEYPQLPSKHERIHLDKTYQKEQLQINHLKKENRPKTTDDNDDKTDHFIDFDKLDHLMVNRPQSEVKTGDEKVDKDNLKDKDRQKEGLKFVKTNYLRDVHRAALKILKLQEAARDQTLNESQEIEYRENMDILNESAQELSKLHDAEEEKEEEDKEESFKEYALENRSTGLSSWFERKKNKYKKKDEEYEDKDRNKEIDRNSGGNRNAGDKEENMEGDDGNEGVSVGLPPEDAAVAEAKPVGLAIAGKMFLLISSHKNTSCNL